MAEIPVRAKLAQEPMGLMGIVRTARRNLLEIIPDLATRQPMVSGRMIRRWHMVMDPAALQRVLLERPSRYPKAEAVKNVLGACRIWPWICSDFLSFSTRYGSIGQ